VRVQVADYPDGLLSRQLSGSDVELVPVTLGSRTPILPDTCLVAPLAHLFAMESQLAIPPSARVTLWTIHPYSVLSMFPMSRWTNRWEVPLTRLWLQAFFGSERRRVRSMVRLAQERGGLLFMDDENLQVTKALLGLEFQPARYLQIPLPASGPGASDRPDPRLPDREGPPVNLAWLGRVTSGKMHMLLRVLEDAAAYAETRGRPLRFHVIGEGDMEDVLRKQAPRSPLLEIRMVGSLIGEALEEYLRRNVDVMFAMGTSNLESARLGIPSVLVDAAFNPLPAGYRYRWLFESSGYSLGRIVSPRALPPNPYTFADLMEAVATASDRRSLGERCRAYYLRHHSMNEVAATLLASASQTELRFGDLVERGYYRPSLVRSLWSALMRLRRALN